MKGPTTQRVLLELLAASDGWSRGLGLVEASNGRVRRGSVYVWLSQLEDSGFVRSREVGSAVPFRREYQITSAGRAALLRDDL